MFYRSVFGIVAALSIYFVSASVLFASGTEDSQALPQARSLGDATNARDLASAIVAKELSALQSIGSFNALALGTPTKVTATPSPIPSPASNPTSSPGPASSPPVLPSASSAASAAATPPAGANALPAPAASPSPAVVIRVPLENWGPRTFNPAYARDPESKLIRRMTQSMLVRRSPDDANTFNPELAESWKLATDGKSFEITLRDGLKWSDGTALRASDWVDAAKLVYDEPSSLSIKIGDVFDWQAKSDRVIALSSPTGRPPNDYLEACERYPLPMERYAAWRRLGSPGSLGTGLKSLAEGSRFLFFDAKAPEMLASGPWKVSDYHIGNTLRLVPNPNFGGGSALPQPWPTGFAIEFVFVRDSQQAADTVAASGSELFGVSADKLWSVFLDENSPYNRALGDAGNLTLSLAFNTAANSVFAAAETRYKIADLIDRQELAQTVLRGSAYPAYGLWSKQVLSMGRDDGQKPDTSAPVSNPKTLNSSPDAATPAPVEALQFSLAYEKGNASRELIATYISRKFAAAGITVQLLPLDFEELSGRMVFGGDWQAALISIDESRAPQTLSKIWPELTQRGATIASIFVQMFREELALPLVRFRNLALIKLGSALSPSTAAWLVNRFQVAKQEFM